MRVLAALFLLALAPAAQAQTVPDLELDNPRIQTVQWQDGMDVLLTVMPGSGLTLMLEAGERIERVTLSDDFDFEVRVSPEGNSLILLADQQAVEGRMVVETDRRTYPFALRIGEGLTAAYLVRFTYGAQRLDPLDPVSAPVAESRWSYRLRGDAPVRPRAIADDGARTYITYAPEQPLPAVFAIGATGDEEMVNGHMRGDVFVIDRVYAELVFRLDEERAQAERNSQPDVAG
jgi:type IV secretion system protein VirB9